MNPVEQLLRQRIGLNPASVGAAVLERTIRRRMQALGLQELNQYRDVLAASRPEWEELLEAVVVPETWFFREPEAFKAFVRLVPAEMQNAKCKMPDEAAETKPASAFCILHSAFPPAPPVRILSLPCATGEEPYSLAMALLDAGVPPARFVIHAVDLSVRALARAARGLYGPNSFRGPALAFRDRHFTQTAAGFELDARVRRCVTFQRGNLLAGLEMQNAEWKMENGKPLSPETRASGGKAQGSTLNPKTGVQPSAFSLQPSFPPPAPYDFIFCRNLLIYFDRATQGQALGQLRDLLVPGGVLFVGPAELPVAADHGFVPAGIPKAFACRKPGADAEMQNAKCKMQKETCGPVTSDPEPRASLSSHSAFPAALARARALADAGELAAAQAVCEAHVQAWKLQNEKNKLPKAKPLSPETRGGRRAAGGPDTPDPEPRASISDASAAQAYYLLGLVTEARGHAELEMQNAKCKMPKEAAETKPASAFSILHSAFPPALAYYRKALYLAPDHYEALVQVALLLSKQGNIKGARSYQRRAAACENRLKAEG